MAPSVASAGFTTGHCEGPSIKANGATLQKKAQELWNKEFNNAALTSGGACELKAGIPTVTYTGTGSGPGLESWGNGAGAGKGNFSFENAYVGTDEPPNEEQKTAIEKEGTGGKLLTIPVVQAAVAIIVHLPAGCTVKDKVAPGRFVFSNATLEGIFHGTITSWAAIKDAKEKVKGKKGACNAPIKRVVRLEGSGTTSIFKKYLNLQNSGEFGAVCEGKPITTTWKKLAESAVNTCWPEEAADPVIHGKGGGGVVAAVAATESTIAYANLADARATFGAPTGQMFWAEIENGSFKKGKKSVATFAEPAGNGETTAKGIPNCTETLYTDGKNKFPPTSTEKVWNEVTTSLVEPHYTICGFSYDLSSTKFEGYGVASGHPATDASSRTASDYLHFELEGGQKLLEGNDYLGLPENAEGHVLKIAKEGAEKISFS
ncbi:MAG TPA: substrate-binding domain-containing protein [Solirubrobacteraceae bacterium]|nr:substrate-binding domain-containing protein [Solirubrobacteraceae bacterium]